RHGFCSTFTHDIVWGVSLGKYVHFANDHAIVIMQIETLGGADNVEEVALVPGPSHRPSVLFLSPSNLSTSPGYAPPHSPNPHPGVGTVIQRTKTVTHAAGKKV
ncbi:hypothetical protein BJY52DRAFT_1402742, partial [Lactarius psammicola]